MLNILTAIKSKFLGSALSNDVGGRIYLDEAPQGTQCPYVVYSVISAPKEKTFTEEYRNTLIQFSLFSDSSGATEISTMYSDLVSLFDECSMTITSNTMVRMKEVNLVTMTDDVTTSAGLQTVKHWAVDFEILTSLN